MPLHKYTCRECGEQFEELVFGEDEKVACPKCGSQETMRALPLISAKGLQSGCSSCNPSSCSSRFT